MVKIGGADFIERRPPLRGAGLLLEGKNLTRDRDDRGLGSGGLHE